MVNSVLETAERVDIDHVMPHLASDFRHGLLQTAILDKPLRRFTLHWPNARAGMLLELRSLKERTRGATDYLPPGAGTPVKVLFVSLSPAQDSGASGPARAVLHEQRTTD